MKRATDKRHPAFLGARLDVLPRLIDRNKDKNGEVAVGVYARQMTPIIGEGAYDAEGHMNTMFLEAIEVGPFPWRCNTHGQGQGTKLRRTTASGRRTGRRSGASWAPWQTQHQLQ